MLHSVHWLAPALVLVALACSAAGAAAPADTGPRESFHLYLLIGQSNMAGRGRVAKEDRTPHPRVLKLDKADQWVPAVDPLHFDKPGAGVGPGLAFGRAMAEASPKVRIGLIPCAAGGSPVTVWRKGASWRQTRSKPYDEALRRAKLALKAGVLKGILWHQGESDSNAKSAKLYQERLVDLVARLRKDLDAPHAAFVAGGLGEFFVRGRPHAEAVNQVLEHIAQHVKRAAFAGAEGLGHKGDKVHFSAASARELGRRYAKAMLALQSR